MASPPVPAVREEHEGTPAQFPPDDATDNVTSAYDDGSGKSVPEMERELPGRAKTGVLAGVMAGTVEYM
jgi:hypothetical protein